MVDINSIGNIFDTNLDFSNVPEKVNLAGVSFEDRQLLIPTLLKGDKVILARDPRNPHDKCAIKVFDKNKKHIGWIPRDISMIIAPEIDAGLKWVGKIEQVTGNEETLRGVVVKLYVVNK